MADSNSSTPGILAVFRYLDQVCDAISTIQNREDCRGHEVFSPTSYHELEHAHHFKPSCVRTFTLVGALTGTLTGFGICLATDWDWPLVVGGKSPGIYSLPAYVVIGFEFTILFGAIATIIGMLWMGRIPNPKGTIHDVRTTDDRFAIFVPGAKVDGPQAEILRQMGAEEIRTSTENY